MRIGMLIDTYKPRVSGVTNYVSINKKYLEEQGHEVYVFTFGDLDHPDDETHIIRSPGIPLVDTGFNIGLALSSLARHLLYTMDVVHVHHPFQSGPLALRSCKPRSIPVVFTNHTRYDLYAQAYLPSLIDSLTEGAIKAYLPVFCRSCDLVVAPSASLRTVLQGLGVDAAIEVVPNGVELEPFRAPSNPVERTQYGITTQDIVLIYVGRLAPEKNLPFLLRSFNGAAQAVSNIHLIFVGEGGELDNLQDQVHLMELEQRVHFTGLVPYPELPRYLAMADIFATASVTEVHPLSVIEAMAAGLPVLGVMAPGVQDSVEDGVTGLLAPEDLAAYTAKMMRMVSETELRQQMGQAARQAVERFDIRRTSRMMAEHYQRLMQLAMPRKRSPFSRLARLFDKWH